MEDESVITQLVCKQCGYKWYPRSPELPKVCPYCKHRNWNEEVPNVKKGRSKSANKRR